MSAMKEIGKKVLEPYMSPVMAVAFSIGSAIGWGSLVVTSSGYLGKAGYAGSIIGLVLGMAVMLIIARNYSYLMQIYPDAGGAYSFSREIFGYDYGFLTAWFLILTYLSILWANATSLPLFAKFFIGPVFEFGKIYTIFGYDVFIGELILTAAGIILVALLCFRSKKAAAYCMTVMVGILSIAIVIAALAALFGFKGSYDNAFVPDSKAVSQIIYIAVISPWAFVGFENISHSSEEFSFKRTGIFRILVISVVFTTILYVLITLLSMTAYPERYGSWLEYIRDRGNLSGLEALPAFYAANHYMGFAGVVLLMTALLSLVITSLIGQTTAASRLFCAMGRDKMIPGKFSEIGKYDTPGKAIGIIAVSALIIPFVGKTAIGWIVDVTCIGATLIYGMVSACAFKRARERDDKAEKFTGIFGLLMMVFYALYTLAPNLISESTIERETYFLFIVWIILGFIFFRMLLSSDKSKKYGNSAIVWASLLALVLLISLIWMRQSMINANTRLQSNIEAYYEQHDENTDEELVFLRGQIDDLEKDDTRAIIMALGMFGFAMLIMFSNHAYLSRKHEESIQIVNTDPLTGVKSKHAYMTMCRDLDHKISGGHKEDFAVVVCDVNGLKHVNDTLGHKAGDKYICAASEMICELFRHSPVYRLGGDEFVVILEGHDFDVRERLMQMLYDQSVENISLGKVIVAGGISDFRRGKDRNIHDVFERADRQMYSEKMSLKEKGSITRD